MEDLVVATYNVHQCVGVDRRRDPGRIAGVIHELRADIVGLQEVDSRSNGTHESAQMDYLAKATGLEPLSGPTIRRPDGDYGNVLLTRWPILASEKVDLSLRGREPRGAIDALISFRDVPVRVVVTHLGLAGWERRRQIRRLAEQLCEKDGRLLVFLGDINEWLPVSRGLRRLGRCLGKSPAVKSYPSWFPFMALDRIWVRPGRAMKAVGTHTTSLSRAASDHLPVWARVEIPSPAGG